MKKISKILFLVFLSCLFLFYSNAKNTSEKGSTITKNLKKTKTENINLKSAYNISSSKIPLYFIQNRGQFNKKALFYARTSKYTIWITKKGLIFDSVRKNKIKNQQKHQYKRDVSRLLFKGANKSPEIVPIDTTNYRVNYFIGKDKSKWKTGISASKAVMYKNIYPHIDLKVYGKGKQIEYDWIVKPGGNPANIRFEFKDVKGTELDKQGNIIIRTEFGKIIHKRPSAYQNKNNKIDVRFKRLSENSYTFNIGKYNRTEKLIIDPLILLYSTYLGGSSHDSVEGIAVDSNGCAYITGRTNSTDFPLQNHYMTDPGDDNGDAFVTKFSTDGQSLVYSTYLGGDNYDYGYGIAVDAKGYAYITGYTVSTDFPLKNPIMNYQRYDDVFVTKLSTDGQSLVYSTYLGGNKHDCGGGIAVDANECAYIIGHTDSTDFPLQNPYMIEPGDGNCDAFVTKFSTDGQSLIYSTYLGGDDYDAGYGIAVDVNGCAYVTGVTSSPDFPLQNPIMNYKWGDAFVTKFSADGQSLVYSTCLGGSSGDWGNSIAVDANECAYVIGQTGSIDFPTQDPYMTFKAFGDAFVTKFSTDGQSLVYSTCLGGSYRDSGSSIAVDANGFTYVTGGTESRDFPLKNPIMNHKEGYDVFVVAFKPFNPLIILNISGAKKTERAWIINRNYTELNLLVIDQSLVNVSKYVIYRKVNNGTYEVLNEFSGSSLIEGSYTYIDKFLDKDKTYTYKFIAYDSSNNIIAISNETII